MASKPAKVYSADNSELRTPTEEFPPPPPSLQYEAPAEESSALDDELDMLTNMLALGLQNTHHPDFFGES